MVLTYFLAQGNVIHILKRYNDFVRLRHYLMRSLKVDGSTNGRWCFLIVYNRLVCTFTSHDCLPNPLSLDTDQYSSIDGAKPYNLG
jgi:hypothetical protein